MRTALRTLGVLFALVSVPVAGFAAGFSIFEAGAKALGMGGAFTAQADDPSAIFFNPAGIAQLDNTQVSLGVSLILTGSEFAGVDPEPGFGTFEETGTLVFPPINAYITRRVHDDMVVGIGLFNPWGLGQDWDNPDSYTGRHIADEVNLQVFDINPTIAWQPDERLSIGVGVQLVYARIDLHRYIQQWDPNGGGYLDVGQVQLEGNSSLDVGTNAGVLVKPHESVSLGVSYRSRVTVEAHGDADFTLQSTGNAGFDAVVASQFPLDQGVRTEVELPWLLSMGAAYSGVADWMFEIDFNLFGWSEFDALGFDFTDDPALNLNRIQDYENKLSIRTGASYQASEELTLRGGYYFDPTPQPKKAMSPLLGDADRHGVSLGFGYDFGSFNVDAFGLILLTDERSTEGKSLDGFNGTYSSSGDLFGLNVGFEF